MRNRTVSHVLVIASLFGALSPTSGQELTTYLVKDTNPGNPSTLNVPRNLTSLNGWVLFRGPAQELWRSDGTAAGTVLVKNAIVSSGGTFSSGENRLLVASGGSVFFNSSGSPSDPNVGFELWKTDGTTTGTVLVKDLRPGSSSSNPFGFVDVNGTLFFVASDSTNGAELWKTDGTAAGTMLVKDIRPGSADSSIDHMRSFNGLLYFRACDGTNGCEPWRSDGTSDGTFMLRNIAPGSQSGLDTADVSKLPAVVGNQVFFRAWDPTIGYELWVTDGTQSGTVLVKDLQPGANLTGPTGLANVNGTLFFSGCSGSGTGCGLWKSNGTAASTALVSDAPYPVEYITDVNGTAYFYAPGPSGQNYELWKSGGTAGTTVFVKDIYPGNNASWGAGVVCPTVLRNFNGTLVFTANDGVNGLELWKSDGSASGTVMIADIFPGSTSGTPNSSCPGDPSTTDSMLVVGNQLFFTAKDATNGIELWLLRQPSTGVGTPRLVNISTRGQVATGDNIMIGGFIVGGAEPKRVVVRGRGPSMAALGVPGTLADPAIRLFSGATPIDFNDNWQSAPNAADITASGFAPTDSPEAAILTTVSPGVPYTVHVTGVGGTSGIAIVEVFELNKPEIPLLNISTRGPVLTGDQVLIGGFIIQGDAAQQVLIIAKGPSLGLSPFNVPGALPDPTLDLYQAGNPSPIDQNDNWVDSTNMAAIQASGNAPTSPLESAILRTLAPGAYTAIVRGKGAFQGIGLVEVYKK